MTIKSLRLASILALLTTAALADAKKPNIVLIFTDDQGWGDVGCYGLENGKTPELDSIASEGIKFTNFYVNCAQCTGSRAALLTGCHYQRVGMPTVFWDTGTGGFHPSETTIAELLKAEGYATACIGKWHLGHRPGYLPVDQGFDYYFGIPYSNDMKFDPKLARSESMLLRQGWTKEKLEDSKAEWKRNEVPLMRNREVIEFPADQKTITKRYTEEAIRFIREHQNEPFFVYLPHTMPHKPLAVSEAFEPSSKGGKKGTEALYAKVLEEIDWSAGQILKTLKELGLDENTLVIFTSDNGPQYGSTAGLRGKKSTPYEGGIRVPCIMRWPQSIPSGKTCDELATTLDILPTVAGIIGAQLPSDRKIDGKDILPLMKALPGAKTPYESYVLLYRNGCVRSGQWKYYPFNAASDHKGNLPKDDPRSKAPVQLYDLSADPYEKVNLAEKHPEICTRLHKAYKDLKTEIKQNARPRGE